LFLLLAAAAANWGIRHIERQVLSAAPSMLRDAGIDPAGLRFDAEYRNVTVSGLLPEGVTAVQVRRVLEFGRGSGGEDIRKAVVVAGEWVAEEATDASVAALATEAIDATGVNNTAGATVARQGSGLVVQESASDKTQEGVGSDPRVNILLAGNELMLSGRDVSKGQVEVLLQAANSAVGMANVKQQWQSEQLPEVSTSTPVAGNREQVQALSSLVAELGEHATAASITLENKVIRGSIEARSERSKDKLKAYAGDGVVITTAVFSDTGAGSASASGAESAEQPDKLVVSQPTGSDAGTEPVSAKTEPAKTEPAKTEPAKTELSQTEPEQSDTTVEPVSQAEPVLSDTLQTDVDNESVVDNAASPDETNGLNDSVNDSDASAAADDQDDDASSAPVQGNAEADNEENQLRREITALQVEIDALQKLIDDDVFFVHDSSAITREALPVLDRVGSAIKRYRRPGVVIEGHTDSLASRRYNLSLSKRRAASVLRYLTTQGVDEKRLRSEGYGEDRPISSNRSKQGRRLNRRVEFIARRPFAKGE
jgi:outer membrane protein OmpA-like peptidoglycan-associated protein